MSPAVQAERVPDPLIPCPAGGPAAAAKAAAKAAKYGKLGSLWGYPACPVSCSSPPQAAPSPTGAEAQQCLESLGVRMRDELSKVLNVG